MKIYYNYVEGNEKIYLWKALSMVPQMRLNSNTMYIMNEASKRSVDSGATRNLRGMWKKIKRSPRARALGTTMAVGGAGIAIAATGGLGAGVAAGGLGAITLSTRVGLMGVDHSYFSRKLKFWKPSDLGGKLGTAVKKMADRENRLIVCKDEINNMVNESREGMIGEEALIVLSMLGRGLHHTAKWMKAGDEASEIIQNLPMFMSEKVLVGKLWDEEKLKMDNEWTQIAGSLLRGLA